MKSLLKVLLYLGAIAPCFAAEALIVKADPAWRFHNDGTVLFRYKDGGEQFAFYGALAAPSQDRSAATAFFILSAELLDAKIAFPIMKEAEKGTMRSAVTTLMIPHAEIDIPEARIYRVIRWQGGFVVRAASDLIPPDITRSQVLRMLGQVLEREVKEEPIQSATDQRP